MFKCRNHARNTLFDDFQVEPYANCDQPQATADRDSRRLPGGGLNTPELQFLQARVVGMPECVFRNFEFPMKTGVKTIHLITQAPSTRKRALVRKSDDEIADDAADDPHGKVKFYDGVLEQYMKRPAGAEVPKGPGSGITINFEEMLYPDYHRHYERIKGTNLKKKANLVESGEFYVNYGQEPPDDVEEEIHDEMYYTIARTTRMPVSWDWLLPNKHGLLYYYQRLLLATPFRCALPSSFISHDNAERSLPRECEIRGIILNSSVTEQVQADATDRLFGPEAVTGMMESVDEYEAIMEVMADGDDGMNEASMVELENGCPLCADTRRLIEEDIASLDNALSSVGNRARPDAPIIDRVNDPASGEDVFTWQRPDAEGPGGSTPVVLKPGQVKAYQALKDAGEVQLRAFLSGEGTSSNVTSFAVASPFKILSVLSLVFRWLWKVDAYCASCSALEIERP